MNMTTHTSSLAQTEIALSMTMPVYHIANRKPASSLETIVLKKKLNMQKIGLAFQEQELLGIRAVQDKPVIALRDIVAAHEVQKDFMYAHGFETSRSAELIGTDKVGRMAIRFKASDQHLGFLQAQVADKIAPIAEMMFVNRMSDNAIDKPVYTMNKTSSSILSVTVDKPCDPQRVVGFFMGVMGNEKSCRRTLNLLKQHGDSENNAALLFAASKKDIAAIIPDDQQGLQALQLLATMSRPSTRHNGLFL